MIAGDDELRTKSMLKGNVIAETTYFPIHLDKRN